MAETPQLRALLGSVGQWGGQVVRAWGLGGAAHPHGTDWALWHQACTGHEPSAKALVHRLTPTAYRMALQMLGKPEDAQDVVQESFLRLWRSQPSDTHGAQLSTYFNTIVINRCKSHLVRQREWSLDNEELTALADVQQSQSDARDSHTGALSSAQLQRALASLPARQRLALAMWAYGDAEVAEIARTLRIDTNAAHQLLHRAKRSLRDKFSGEIPC